MTPSTPDPLAARLRRLAPSTEGGDPRARTTAIRARAARRRTRRRLGLALTAVPIIALALLAATALPRDDGGVGVTSGAPRSTADDIRFSTVDGLSLTVSPGRELTDGQQVQVRIYGLELLRSPLLVQCASDLTPNNALERCDLRALDRSEVGPQEPTTLQPEMTVTVRRTIALPGEIENGPATPYDCASEGCVLAVGEQVTPVRGTAVTLHFAEVPPKPAPGITVRPATGLRDRQRVTVAATGLRPNSTYGVKQCSVDDPVGCDDLAWPSARTDADGRLTTDLSALPVLYGWMGRVDCTQQPCHVVVIEEGGIHAQQAPISFAEDVTPLTPSLRIEPGGPYRDQDEVTVTGAGFPPGIDVGGSIGQCPNDKDTSVEERCTYAVITPAITDGDGNFEMTVRIQATLSSGGSCTDGAGCHLGWVLNHGPTIAKTPLDFQA